MADWTNPITWGATPITVNLLNEQIRDNTEHLKDPPTDEFSPAYASGAVTYQTTSTSFVNVDTDFNLSITTFGGDILVSFMGRVLGTYFLDFTLNGSRVGGNDGICGANLETGTQLNTPSFLWLLTDMPAGDYQINLVWKTLDTASMDGNFPPQFLVREIS